jgi:hypothetical protein
MDGMIVGFSRSWRFCVLVVIPGFAMTLVSCSAQKVPVNPLVVASPTPGAVPTPNPSLGTALSAGGAAVVGFTTEGTQNDQFAFVILEAVAAQTQVDITDENWDGTEFSISDGGMITWVADKAYPAGTLVQVLPTSNGNSGSTHSYAVNIYSGGVTLTNVTGPGTQTGTYAFDPNSPIQVTTVGNTGGGLTGLAQGGDQVMLFQGPVDVGETAAGLIFFGALTYNTPWLAGTPTPTAATGANTYLPPGLTSGVNAIALTGAIGNGGTYNCAVTTGTAAVLSAALNNPANWSLSMTGNDLPLPALSCVLSVQ